MRPDTLARLSLALLVVLLIVLGVRITGGPETGRMEERDRTRLSDLRDVATTVRAAANAESGTLPEALDSMIGAPSDLRLADPFTGAPYRYERLSDRAFRVCADFELPDRIRRPQVTDFDGGSGCLTYTYQP
ncbi:hypothetical protein [Tropicimonas isoalkanivorans]|uniref:Uncharacterized protein n=1 Tax=Tropicimonas isoalkanivorans TaxID=441112 RepID=A0A1I1P842_9RHOB|nr:hypothetical protein [Tropicimonas isoalkanivorans]SFD06101.1 hypothetical protein SAMN04488094_11458 [Tropicimonas isoalkanivorans]